MRAHDAQRAGDVTMLDVVGDGPDREALVARAASLGLAERVRWYGALPQPALVPLYQGARVLAIPSREEGLGLVAVEAQLCGTPVVAYADGGLFDVVRPDHGGTLVTVGDTRAFGEALARLLARTCLTAFRPKPSRVGISRTTVRLESEQSGNMA